MASLIPGNLPPRQPLVIWRGYRMPADPAVSHTYATAESTVVVSALRPGDPWTWPEGALDRMETQSRAHAQHWLDGQGVRDCTGELLDALRMEADAQG